MNMYKEYKGQERTILKEVDDFTDHLWLKYRKAESHADKEKVVRMLIDEVGGFLCHYLQYVQEENESMLFSYLKETHEEKSQNEDNQEYRIYTNPHGVEMRVRIPKEAQNKDDKEKSSLYINARDIELRLKNNPDDDSHLGVEEAFTRSEEYIIGNPLPREYDFYTGDHMEDPVEEEYTKNEYDLYPHDYIRPGEYDELTIYDTDTKAK